MFRAMALFWVDKPVLIGDTPVVEVEDALHKLTNFLERTDLAQLFRALDAAEKEMMAFIVDPETSAWISGCQVLHCRFGWISSFDCLGELESSSALVDGKHYIQRLNQVMGHAAVTSLLHRNTF